MKHTKVLLLLLTIACFVGCKQKPSNTNSKPIILSTTGMLNDVVINLLGDKVEAIALMGPGVDPHLYKATQGDLSKLQKADLIIYNGLHLEGKLNDILEKYSERKDVLNFSDGLPKSDLLYVEEGSDVVDPHIWFDISLWSKGVKQLSSHLQLKFPEWSKDIAIKEAAYLNALNQLIEDAKAAIATIPQKNRVLITSHDAFQYFGRLFGMEINALQGISTAAEFGVKDRKELVDFITERKLKAVFVESSVSSKPLEAILEDCKQRGHDVSIGGELFSDAMGAAGTDEGTYEGMVRHNVNSIVEGLK